MNGALDLNSNLDVSGTSVLGVNVTWNAHLDAPDKMVLGAYDGDSMEWDCCRTQSQKWRPDSCF